MVCNPLRMGRWSEPMVVCVCHTDEVMREADANDTSENWGPPAGCLSYRLFRSTRVIGEH